MILAFYFFRQFVPPFLFGTVLFMFVLLLDRLFDIVDLIFNKGVAFFLVLKMFALFLPTVLPLTFPMAMLLACLVTFGRLSEENELTAVRAAGISLLKVLWIPFLFALLISLIMVPFNTRVAPWSNRSFRTIYEQIVTADPLINIEPKKFFAIKNIKIFAESVDKSSNKLRNVFIYQLSQDNRPAERIFARIGEIESTPTALTMTLHSGQLQRYDEKNPYNMVHTAFGEYVMTIPLLQENKNNGTRFRNIASSDLKKLAEDLKKQGLSPSYINAEYHLRYAIAFAPFALIIIGMPLATALKKGGKGFGFGVSIVVIFIYYTLLIFGLTMAEKAKLPAAAALWMANVVCFAGGGYLINRMRKL